MKIILSSFSNINYYCVNVLQEKRTQTKICPVRGQRLRTRSVLPVVLAGSLLPGLLPRLPLKLVVRVRLKEAVSLPAKEIWQALPPTRLL